MSLPVVAFPRYPSLSLPLPLHVPPLATLLPLRFTSSLQLPRITPVTTKEGAQEALNLGGLQYVETSALTGVNVDLAFEMAARLALGVPLHR